MKGAIETMVGVVLIAFMAVLSTAYISASLNTQKAQAYHKYPRQSEWRPDALFPRMRPPHAELLLDPLLNCNDEAACRYANQTNEKIS